MLCPAKKGYSEEDYYFSEWTAAEKERGEHLAVMKFVSAPPESLSPWQSLLKTAYAANQDQPPAMLGLYMPA